MSQNAAKTSGQAPVYARGFFAEFTPPSQEEWLKTAQASLKGAPWDKVVFTKTHEGITLKPIYRQEDLSGLAQVDSLPGQAPYLRGIEAGGFITHPWHISQELPGPSPAQFNQVAREDLTRGQTGLSLVLDQAGRQGLDPGSAPAQLVGAGGVSLANAADLAAAFLGIDLTAVPLFCQAGANGVPLMACLAAALASVGRDAKRLSGCVGGDPLGELARRGELELSLDRAYDAMAALTSWALDQAPQLGAVWVSASGYHNAGANAVQELGCALATGAAYLRALIDRGLTVDQAAPRFWFGFSLGGHFFMEMAKLRAARMLWAQVVEAFGGGEDAQKMRIHGRTSAYTKTVYDPYVNLLRNTTEAFAGVVGGVNSLHVACFDEAVRPPQEFSRRVSRNLQILLQQEAHLTHPIDPAGGSWFVESLTDEVASAAWAWFQELEAAGGMAAALQAGLPQKAIAQVAAGRQANLGIRKEVLVGTNMYANLGEKPLESEPWDQAAFASARARELAGAQAPPPSLSGQGADLVAQAIKAAQSGASLGALSQALAGDGQRPQAEPLAIHRAAQAYEELRTRGLALRSAGANLKVFLANLGPIPQHKARAEFTTGFFEVGGFEVLSNLGFATPQEAASAALDSGAKIIVICSSDKAYPQLVPPLCQALKQKDPSLFVILAGKPAAEHEPAYRQAGLDDFIFVRGNCLALLGQLQERSARAHD